MADFQLDLRAYLCPLPLLMTKRAVGALQAGQTLAVQINDSVAIADFVQLARTLHCDFQHTPHTLYFKKENENEK